MNGSHTPPRTPLEADTYDSILHLLETLTTSHSGTRLQITSYETRIRDLENLNSELLKQNEELRSQLLLREPVPGSALAPTTSPSPPSSLSPAEPIVVTSDLEKAQYLQDALISEREAFATREESLTARIWGLETAVTDSLRDLLRERRAREEIEWKSRSMTNSVVLTGIGGGSPAREGGLARVKGGLRRMGGELKAANEEIERLREEIERLPFESTVDETEAEVNMLKDGLKRIERLALAYAPLKDEMGLLDAVEVWKKEFVEVCKERRRRKKKEEKLGTG
ncbi:unnamed protein product [Tuber melanosporum]|uniref:(Perigord truffle) hypothetical protein n=1 Tax=Tuber melanosporum (strain Mel28) TaxID=656061 RepID=D5GE38_TUBMM|nr:uncharacterized protein GSTUM_00006363001 [Tuber melanosporum]CAZ82781.1 unnamed protein product [Tuber melanosporum]